MQLIVFIELHVAVVLVCFRTWSGGSQGHQGSVSTVRDQGHLYKAGGQHKEQDHDDHGILQCHDTPGKSSV